MVKKMTFPLMIMRFLKLQPMLKRIVIVKFVTMVKKNTLLKMATAF